MALTAIGPVTISHGNPAFATGAAPTTHGIEAVTITGTCSWDASKTLRELVKNPHTQTTVGGFTGVQEWLYFDDDLLDDMEGDYLLLSFDRDASHKDSLTTTAVPFTLAAAFLGDDA